MDKFIRQNMIEVIEFNCRSCLYFEIVNELGTCSRNGEIRHVSDYCKKFKLISIENTDN